MSIIATIAQFLMPQGVLTFVTEVVTVANERTADEVGYTVTWTPSRAVEVDTEVTVTIANAGGGGENLVITRTILAGRTVGLGVFERQTAISGAFVATVTGSTNNSTTLTITTPTIAVPAFVLAPITFGIVSLVRDSNTQYTINMSATIDNAAPSGGISAEVQVTNFNSSGGIGSYFINILQGATQGTSTQVITITGTGATGVTFDITISQGAVTAGYGFNNLPQTISVPAFVPTDTPIDITVSADRTATNSVTYTVLSELDSAATENVEFTTALVNSNGIGGTRNEFGRILTGQSSLSVDIVTTISGNPGSNNSPFTVTVRPVMDGSTTSGYVQNILTPMVNVPSFLAPITFDNYSLDLTPQNAAMRAMAVNNGHIYVTGLGAPRSTFRYTINADHSLTYDNYSNALPVGNPRGIEFFNDKMYLLNESNDTIHRYTVNGDDSLTIDTYTFSTSGPVSNPIGIAAHNNKLYVSDLGFGNIHRYSIDGSGDLTYDNFVTDVSAQDSNVTGLSVYNNNMYVIGSTVDRLYRYVIEPDGSLVYDNFFFDYSAQSTSMLGIAFNGNRLYMSETNNPETVYRYVVNSD